MRRSGFRKVNQFKMQRVTLVLFLSALAWSQKTSKSLYYMPVLQNPGSGSLHGYQPLQNPHSPMFTYWSNLHAGHSSQTGNSHFTYVPLNSHHLQSQGRPLYEHQGQQYWLLTPPTSGNAHKEIHSDQVNEDDDTEVIVASHGNSQSQRSGDAHDHDTVIMHPESHTDLDRAAISFNIPISDLWSSDDHAAIVAKPPSGFQRGHVESRPNSEYGYKAKVNQENIHSVSSGFQRGHVEHRPHHQITKTAAAQPYSSRNTGFNRGAVEAKPAVTRQAVSLKRASSAKVICYFANWSWYRQAPARYLPENVDPNLCTHILYAFATYDKKTVSLKESDPALDDENQLMERIVNLRSKNPSLKVILAVGGWSDSGDDKYSLLVNSPSNRRKFARESLAFLKKYGFDGISIDWHYPVCWQSDCSKGPKTDRNAFSELMRELKSVYSPEGYLVAASLSGYKEVIDVAYDIPKLSQNLDFMNIMTYDYHGSWESRTGHLSPLYEGPPSEDLKPTYNSNFTMEYYVSKGADRSKLILGIPFYGQSYMLENQFDHSIGSLAEGPGNPGEYTQQAGMLAYYEICKRVKDLGWTARKDTSGSWGPYAFKENQWVGYDDMDSVRRKARYVNANSFGGVFAFTLDLDDFNNDCCNGDQPLLRTLAKELLGVPFAGKRNDCSRPAEPVKPDKVPEASTPRNPAALPSAQPVSTANPTQVAACSVNQRSSVPVASSPSPCSAVTSTAASVTTPRQEPVQPPARPTPPPRPASTPKTTTVVASTSSPSDKCHYTNRPHPTDCNAYYSCVSEKEMLRKCPFGLHWNRDSHTCDWPDRAGCQKNPEMVSEPSVPVTESKPKPNPPTQAEVLPVAPTRPAATNEPCVTGTFYDGPTCDQYYLCSNGVKKVQMCGPGLHWNNERKLCDWPKDSRCEVQSMAKDDTKSEEGCQEGEFFGSKRDCEMYYVCVHGSRMEFRCQNGLNWNERNKVCDWPANAKCTVSEPSEPAVVPSYPSPAPTRPPTQGTTTASPWTTSTTVATLYPTSAPEVVRPPSSDLSGDFMIVCYFTNWAWYRPGMGKYKPEHIEPDLCTHYVYGFAVLDHEQLLIKPHDSWADLDNKFYEQVTALKRSGKKVTIAIGGWNDSAGDKYSRLVSNPTSRRRFIQNVVEFIQNHNFDGLDLDWEYPKCWQVDCSKGPEPDKSNFAMFVKEIHDAFQPHGLLLSSAVSPSKTVIDAGYDVPALSRYLDWIAVMTYDYHGQWDKKTGHVAPLYFHEEDDLYYFNANYSINYWINQGTDRRKIVMGMPLYGQSFTLTNPEEHGLNAPATGGGTAGEYTRASGFLAYYEICNQVQRNGWTVVHDETGAMGPYAYKGNQWVSYDDVAMIRKKSELIREWGLGGGMIWALDLDDFKNSCGQGQYPLLTTIRSVLGRPPNGATKVQPAQLPKKDKPKKKPEQGSSSGSQGFGPIRNEDVEHCDEQFRRHEKDCNKYYQCLFGRYVEQSCPPGTVWNNDRCDWPSNTDCQAGSGSGPASKPKPKPVATTTTTPAPTFPILTTPKQVFVPTTEYIPPAESFGTTTYRPPRRSTTPTPTKDPEWCRLNWCPTPKPLPPNKHEIINMPPSDYKVVCYFTNWAWYRQGIGKYKPEDIDFNLCTHIAYGFAVLNPTTLVIKPHDGWADIDNQFYKQVTQLRQRGVKVVLALGGWNDSLGDKYSRMANDPAARKVFIDQAIEFIETWDFDGLDLDWEYPKCWQVDCEKGPASDKQAFAALVRELREAFTPRGLLLSAAVSPNKKVIDAGYDVPSVSRDLDWIAVMTYDYHGQWDKKTGHNAPMYLHPETDNPVFNTNFSINYWIDQGADRRKIIMGMPLYGQSFTLVDPTNTGLNSKSSGGAQAGEYTRSAGFLAYYEICNYVQKRGWTVVQDESRAIGPYAYKGNQWVSFDDIDQLRRKSEYIKKMGLGGGMIWALDLDDFRGVCGCEEHPLLKTINRVLRQYPVPDPQCRSLSMN